MISYNKQKIEEDDVRAVADALRNHDLSGGELVSRFESGLCRYTKCDHCLVANSATSALHLACLALGLTYGDLVWTTPITFVATANVAKMCGADVDFVDIDFSTNNISVSALEQKLNEAETLGFQLPKVVIAVHMGGLSADMKAIADLAQRYGFKVIEDASHALGGVYDNSKIGDCRYSDLAVFSFHPVKMITTGEGGCVVGNNSEYFNEMCKYREHGLFRLYGSNRFDQLGQYWAYEQRDIGFNYRLSGLSAALGISQLAKLDSFVSSRRSSAMLYLDLFDRDERILTPSSEQINQSSNHLFIIKLLDDSKTTRNYLLRELENSGIQANFHYMPLYKHPFYGSEESWRFPEAERYAKTALSLPLFVDITSSQIDEIVSSIKDLL